MSLMYRYPWLRHGATIFVVLLSIFAFNTSRYALLLLRDRPYDSSTGGSLQSSNTSSYNIQVLSTDPMMLYLEHFIAPYEVDHLLHLGEELYSPSLIYNQATGASKSYRTSESCVLPNDDAIVLRVKERVFSFLGLLSFDGVEALQLVRYRPSQLFALHHDWFDTPRLDRHGRRYNRLASFFLYLDANCTSGATYFPNLSAAIEPDDHRFSTTSGGTGLGIVPIAGSGVFWMNLKENNEGDERVLHAGLPVEAGTKVGMNIWVTKLVD